MEEGPRQSSNEGRKRRLVLSSKVSQEGLPRQGLPKQEPQQEPRIPSKFCQSGAPAPAERSNTSLKPFKFKARRTVDDDSIQPALEQAASLDNRKRPVQDANAELGAVRGKRLRVVGSSNIEESGAAAQISAVGKTQLPPAPEVEQAAVQAVKSEAGAPAQSAPVIKTEPPPTAEALRTEDAAFVRIPPVVKVEPPPTAQAVKTEAAALAQSAPVITTEPPPTGRAFRTEPAASARGAPFIKSEPSPTTMDIHQTASEPVKSEAFAIKAGHGCTDELGAAVESVIKSEPCTRQMQRPTWRTGALRIKGASTGISASSLGNSSSTSNTGLGTGNFAPATKEEVKVELTENGQATPRQALPGGLLPMTTDGPCAPDLRMDTDAEEDRKSDFTGLCMKDDHYALPIYVCPDGRIVFETWHSKSAQVADFLIAIAEPVSRPELIHEYQITMLSLNAAVSTGIEVETIIKLLRKLSKNELAPEFIRFIKDQGRSIGKLKLVLRNQRHFLEADDSCLLAKLLTNHEILNSLVDQSFAETISQNAMMQRMRFAHPSPDSTASNEQDILDEQAVAQTNASAEIHSMQVETVKSAAHQMNMPLLQEYEYRQDRTDANPELSILLRDSANLRPYQQRALSKMFAVDGVAKSGIVVLPCGAGKTLMGIAACSRIQRRTLVLTTTAVAVDQWKRQFIEYTTLAPEDIYMFTADHKRPIEDHERRACVLISTYSMLGFGGKRTGDAELILNQIEQLDWGLMIVDEVQVMPARTFRTVATTVKAHCCLGLTATLVREDDLIYDLHWLIGPKLYEANWQQLQDEGFLARVRCVEVWCEMAKPFFAEYLRALDEKDGHKRRALWNCNPNKLKVCEYLIKVHESRGDKTIVFSDNIFILEKLAKQLGRYYICGKVDMRERMQILAAFKESLSCNTIFLSQVGDNAIDIPAASVIVQISSHYGSRRQEAQRLGRILRPKPKSLGSTSKFNAFFYSLVSRDTQEMYYANRRQQFLVEQGYNYHILRNLADKRMDNDAPTYASEDSHLQLLKEVLETLRRGDMGEAEEDVALHDSNMSASAAPKAAAAEKSKDTDNIPSVAQQAPTSGSSRQAVSEKKISLASLSGGLDGSYAVTGAFRQKTLKPDGG